MDTNSVATELNWRSDLMKDKRNYQQIGHIWKIVLESAAGNAGPRNSVAQTVGLTLDWYGYENVNGQNKLPRIAQDTGRNVLLMLDPVKRIDGKVGLPDIPDPEWTPALVKDSDIAWTPKRNRMGKIIPGQKPPAYEPQRAPFISQSLYERARGRMKETNYLVFGPIAQILVRPVKDEPEGVTFLGSEGWILKCRADVAGKHLELLVDERTGESFFYGGQFEIWRAG
jgi:hypothetical protein